MIPFFKKKQREKAYIALDIGTEMIKALLFTIEEKQNVSGEVIGKRGVIKGVGKVSQRFSDMQNGTITDLSSVLDHCKEAIRLASLEAKLAPSHVILGIAGEYVKGITRTLSHRRDDHSSKINLAELRNIIHKLQWRAFGDVRKTISEETGYSEIDIKLVNSAIVDVRIDGYRVSNPLGFQGKEVKLSIFNSFAPIAHYDAMQNVADELNLDLLGVISEPYAISSAIDLEGESKESIIIDIGANSTDVAMIQDGTLVGSKMFAIGGRTLTKRLAVELNIAYSEAEKLKRAYTDGRLEQKSKKIISDIIKNDLEVWLDGIVLSLSEFKKIDVLPSKIWISGGGSLLPQIKEALNNRKWYKKLPFTRAPQVDFILPSQLLAVIDDGKTLKGAEDIVPMSLVHIGIELAGEETIIQRALKKVIGIMKV